MQKIDYWRIDLPISLATASAVDVFALSQGQNQIEQSVSMHKKVIALSVLACPAHQTASCWQVRHARSATHPPPLAAPVASGSALPPGGRLRGKHSQMIVTLRH